MMILQFIVHRAHALITVGEWENGRPYRRG